MLPGYGSRVISDGVAGSANSGVGTPVRAGGLAKALLADVAYERLVAKLRHGEVRAGEFVSIPTLVRMLAMPLAPVREAVKRAEARSLVSVLPKRGVSIMTATAAEIRDCLDLRSILEEEAARRLIASPLPPPLGGMWNERLRIVEGSLEGADSVLTKRVVDVELSLHDFLATGIAPSPPRSTLSPATASPSSSTPGRFRRRASLRSWRNSSRFSTLSNAGMPKVPSTPFTPTTARRCAGGAPFSRPPRTC